MGGAGGSTTPEDAFVRSHDGTRLHYQWYEPEDVRAVVVFLHGYGDHGARYGELAGHLTRRGVAFMALDYRGHGTADGQRGYCSRFADYLSDLETGCSEARRRLPEAPLGLIGHSHGGLITLRALCHSTHSASLTPVVLSAPFLKFRKHTPGPKRWLAHVASRLAPRLALGQGLQASELTHDPDVRLANRQDRLTHQWATARWFTECLEAQRFVAHGVAQIRAPTLWLVGSDDPVSDPVTIRRTYEQAGGNKRLVSYDGFYHELFHEIGRDRVFDDVASWLDRHLLSQ